MADLDQSKLQKMSTCSLTQKSLQRSHNHKSCPSSKVACLIKKESPGISVEKKSGNFCFSSIDPAFVTKLISNTQFTSPDSADRSVCWAIKTQKFPSCNENFACLKKICAKFGCCSLRSRNLKCKFRLRLNPIESEPRFFSIRYCGFICNPMAYDDKRLPLFKWRRLESYENGRNSFSVWFLRR